MRLKDKVALITGAGSGMGRATAQLFSREGARVVVADINQEAGRETVAIIKAEGGKAIFVEADVADEAEATAMVKSAVNQFGRLDILFNNAGMPMSPQPIEQVPVELWDRVMAVNVRSIFLAVRAAVPIMKAQGGGVILITSSIMGNRARPGYCAYAASKAAATHLARELAIELAPANIRVNALSPVAADTPMLSTFIGNRDIQEGRKAFMNTIPLGRLCDPWDVAHTALFLASDEATFLTGVDIPVDGGRGV